MAPSIDLKRGGGDTGHERMRREELRLALSSIPRGARVLEIGGGSGFQAALLAAEGCEVVSIDVAQKPSPEHQGFQKQYWPVESYDGRRLPFGDGEFDVVYSSHMLLHVLDTMPQFLAEVRRVLRPGGLTLHVVPSASWRWWTNVLYYFDLLRRIGAKLARRSRPAAGDRPGNTGGAAPVPVAARINLLLWPEPVGPSRNTIVEIIAFRRSRWAAAFRQAGYEDVKSAGSAVFYSGFLFLPDLPLTTRRWMAKLLGSSSHLIAARRPKARAAQPPR
jgi:SAM-dependent methyltransferase